MNRPFVVLNEKVILATTHGNIRRRDTCPRFRVRSGTFDWEKICSTDIDAIIESRGALARIEPVLDTCVFSQATIKEFRRAGMAATTMLVQLLQLSVEYLLQVQDSLLNENQMQITACRAAETKANALEQQLKQVSADRDLAKSQLRHYRALAHAATNNVRFLRHAKRKSSQHQYMMHHDSDDFDTTDDEALLSSDDELDHDSIHSLFRSSRIKGRMTRTSPRSPPVSPPRPSTASTVHSSISSIMTTENELN